MVIYLSIPLLSFSKPEARQRQKEMNRKINGKDHKMRKCQQEIESFPARIDSGAFGSYWKKKRSVVTWISCFLLPLPKANPEFDSCGWGREAKDILSELLLNPTKGYPRLGLSLDLWAEEAVVSRWI